MEQKKRRTWPIVIAVILALCCCSVIILGGVGYYLYSNGQLNLNEVTGYLGFGPSIIEIANLSDSTLYVEVTYEDEEVTGEVHTHSSLELGSFDIRTVSGLSSREYQIVFTTNSGNPAGGTCTLRLRGGDHLTFFAIPEGIGVVQEGEEVTGSYQVNILTASICQGE